MRKIESQMIAAIKGKRNWSSGNTSVHYSEDYKSSAVYLHGNLIAIVYENDAELFDACLLYTSPSPRDGLLSRMPSSA